MAGASPFARNTDAPLTISSSSSSSSATAVPPREPGKIERRPDLPSTTVAGCTPAPAAAAARAGALSCGGDGSFSQLRVAAKYAAGADCVLLHDFGDAFLRALNPAQPFVASRNAAASAASCSAFSARRCSFRTRALSRRASRHVRNWFGISFTNPNRSPSRAASLLIQLDEREISGEKKTSCGRSQLIKPSRRRHLGRSPARAR